MINVILKLQLIVEDQKKNPVAPSSSSPTSDTTATAQTSPPQQQQEEAPSSPQYDRSPGSPSPYRDFLNYVNVAPSQGFSHYDSIGTPIQSPTPVMSSFHIPSRPPGPLRTIEQTTVNDIIPNEGKDLEIYYQSITYFSGLLLKKQENEFNLLALYMVLSTLDWDNKKTQPLPYPCTPPYESDIVYPYFTYALQLTRTLDNFSKKKRKNYLAILENEDRETFLNRNMLLLHYALQNTIVGYKLASIEDAVLVLIDRFLENYESLPSFKYGSYLWKEIENTDKDNTMSQQDKILIRNFTHAYLLYQKLHLENKNNTKFRLDPTITQKYENASHIFSLVLHQLPAITPYSGLLQNAVDSILGAKL
eukprot:gene19005-22750_t